MLTPQQKIAKLEADLADARLKAEEKSAQVVGELLNRRLKLAKQIEERQTKINEINEEIAALGEDPLAVETKPQVEDVDTGEYT
jgi:peptidoglycan hydrolase CwlO-like protein